jgi:RNA polymerase sigma factor for flagellar operon FliA
VSLDDLFQAGALGLINAVDRFDPQKDVRFMSYARF